MKDLITLNAEKWQTQKGSLSQENTLDADADFAFSEALASFTLGAIHGLFPKSVARNWPWDNRSLEDQAIKHWQEQLRQAQRRQVEWILFDMGLFRIKDLREPAYNLALSSMRRLIVSLEKTSMQMALPFRWPLENPKSTEFLVSREIVSDMAHDKIQLCAEICCDELQGEDALAGFVKKCYFELSFVRFRVKESDDQEMIEAWKKSLKEQGFQGEFAIERV